MNNIEFKINELQSMQKELKFMYAYYIKKSDYVSLENISRQLYKIEYAIQILKELEE